MSTEITTTGPATALAEQMDYARAVSSASMLPDTYRGKPADVLLAVGLGASMGLSPAESLYRISVIKGKPTAGAELIAANVRKAGHKLRVRGDDTSATAIIVRADDLDYEFTVTRDLAWAKQMGLANNDNYKKQPGTMLQWRAITACARVACPEALYGVTYTPDEMFDMDGAKPAAKSSGGRDRLRSALAKPEAEPVEAVAVATETDGPMTDRTRGHLFALFTQKGITTREHQIAGASKILGREIQSRSEITEPEALLLIETLGYRQDADPTTGEVTDDAGVLDVEGAR